MSRRWFRTLVRFAQPRSSATAIVAAALNGATLIVYPIDAPASSAQVHVRVQRSRSCRATSATRVSVRVSGWLKNTVAWATKNGETAVSPAAIHATRDPSRVRAKRKSSTSEAHARAMFRHHGMPA